MPVIRTSILPASAEKVWYLLQRSETLAFLAKGMISYDTVDEWPELWEEGVELNLKPRLYGLPPGDHFVKFVTIDPARSTIITNERSRAVKRWDHTMYIEPMSKSTCRYTDSIEIEAGIKGPLIRAFAGRFYTFRHRRWPFWLDLNS